MSKKSVKKPDYAKFEANRAVKKKNKKKKTTAIVSSVIAACVFIIAAIVAVNVLSPSVTAELTSSAWVPEGAKNASGDEVEMSEVYNTNYSAYQGSMSFSDDGTFTLWLSPGSPDDGTHSGKYTVSASDKVNLSFDDGTNTSAILTQKNGKISAVVLKYNDYEITFVKQKRYTVKFSAVYLFHFSIFRQTDLAVRFCFQTYANTKTHFQLRT